MALLGIKSFGMKANRRLSDLKPGESGVICSIEDDEIVLRMMEMGFVEGETVKVIHTAPIGDPVMVEIIGYHVALRLEEADKVLLMPDERESI